MKREIIKAVIYLIAGAVAAGVGVSPKRSNTAPAIYKPRQETAKPIQEIPDSRTARADIYSAIRCVESGGNDYATGDYGRSLGPVQCGRAAWKDACEYGKTDLRYEEYVWDFTVCKQIMTLYWQRYDCDTDEKKARVWNGGPAGHLKDSTIPYWEKVKTILDRRSE